MDEPDLGRDGPLTAARGRRAPAAELRLRLPSAPTAYLEGAVDNPELTPQEMALLLRNRSAPPALLARVARDRRWTKHYELRRGLVRHPRTPLAAARALLPHLYWKDLAETCEDARLHPALRRQAERTLTGRFPEMTLGERIALARRAAGSVISEMCGSGESGVLRALLGNPRVKEQDAVVVASREEVPGDVLRWLAEHPKWGARRAVRMALIRNPRTPVAVSLGLAAKLPRTDLGRLAEDEEIPRIVRVGAVRHLEAGNPRGGRRS